MREGFTEVVFILDRSGSMRGLEADTIGGFNSMIEKQQREEGEAEGEVWLGVLIPGSEYRCNRGCRQIWNRGRQSN